MHSNDVARLGAGIATMKLADRWGEVHVFKGEHPLQYLLRLQNKNGDRVNLRPKVKMKGDVWQDSINVEVGNYTLWIMADLSGDTPEFYIAPAQWMVDMIRRNHQAWLDKMEGQRPRTPDSDHTAFTPAQVAQWKDAWELIDDPGYAGQVG